MLSAYPEIPDEDETASGPVWIDLLNPSEDEIALAEARFGAPIPTLLDLSEIETSSRLRATDGRLRLSTPLLCRAEGDDFQLSPAGFLFSPELLVTVRFAPTRAFGAVAEDVAGAEGLSAGEVFVRLLEEVVDRYADNLERVGADLDRISRQTFGKAAGALGRKTLNNAALTRTLSAIGEAGGGLSQVRDALLGVGRITPFVLERGRELLGPELTVRLTAVRQDIVSLNDYETHLSDKNQFLLDAVLGLINVVQNDIFKVLTVVSVVGIPPTLLASIYGMNFKHMPELDWSWGYPFGLAMIALSTALPLAWFKWRRWI